MYKRRIEIVPLLITLPEEKRENLFFRGVKVAATRENIYGRVLIYHAGCTEYFENSFNLYLGIIDPHKSLLYLRQS